MAIDDARPLFETAVPWKRFLLRNAVALIGLSALVFSAWLAVALMSWSVADPSLSHASGEPVRNLAGRPGAIAADVLMQLLGLASAVLVIPFAALSWRLARCEPPRGLGWRLSAALLATLAAAVALEGLAVPASWPLPIGLGGIIGDRLWIFAAPHVPEGLASQLTQIGFAVLALVLTFYASSLTGRRPSVIDEDEDDIDDEEEEAADPRGARAASILMKVGALTHMILSAKGSLGRAGKALAAGYREARETTQRREPVFDPDYDEVDFEDEDDFEDEPQAAGRKRVRKSAAAAKASGPYEPPSVELLEAPSKQAQHPSLKPAALEENARLLEGVLEDFGVRGEIINVRPGPVVTLYELEPAPGIKSSRVIGLADDIARSMSAIAARVAVVPGRNVIGIELPNAHRETVHLREQLESTAFGNSKQRLALALGKTIGGEPVIADLAKMPHLLIAGTTGSGKSVGVNAMILSLLYRLTPEQCRLIMIDPKMLELSIYDGIPHLLSPVVTDPKKAVVALKWTVREMEERYKKMSKVGVRNIDGFNQRLAQARDKGETISRTIQTGFDEETGEAIFETEELDLQPMPYIVVIIDEMADLMLVAGKDIEGTVQRLAQMARAAGIHVIMATQRPSVDVITGTIKANFPTRISFQVTSKIDSRTILGEQGAEQLLGMGDMLYMAGGGRIQRVHGPFVSDEAVEDVVNHLKAQGVPEYLDAVTEDIEEDVAGGAGGPDGGLSESADLYDQAVAIVIRDRKASTSYVQRRLSIGYNRAATLIERMEQEGVISAANHAGKREVLVPEDGAT